MTTHVYLKAFFYNLYSMVPTACSGRLCFLLRGWDIRGYVRKSALSVWQASLHTHYTEEKIQSEKKKSTAGAAAPFPESRERGV